MPWILLSAAAAKVRIFNVWNVRLDPANGERLVPSCEPAPRKRKQAGPTLLWHAKCCKRGTPPKMRTCFWLLTKNFSKCQCSQWIHDFGKGSHILWRPGDLRSFHPKVPHKFEQRARPISTSKWRMRHLTRWRCSRQVPKEQTKVWIDFGNIFFAAGDLSTFTTHM